ncbi:MAG TPA: hypothetical protein VFU73_09695 [Actinocrinis sp.]|nr:hypothetical protein [Actinocrinis sp.]
MDDTIGAAGGRSSMLVSVRMLIEEANAPGDVKHLVGEVRSFEELLRPESLDRLAAASPGVLAYLAFHPDADLPVTEYVRNGSLAGDSGPRILVLFAASGAAWAPRTSDDPRLFAIPGVAVSSDVHPSYEMIRTLFTPQPSPPLPGIVFFRDFGEDSEAVYASLSGLDTAAQVTERMRAILSLVAQAGTAKEPEHFADDISIALQKQRLPHARTGRRSLREWFVHGYQAVYDHRGDILAAAALVP